MKSGDNKGCIDKTENRTKHNLKGACDSCIYHRRDYGTDLPADRSYYKMCCHNRKHKTAERNHYHGDHLRCDLPEKFFKINQYKGCHDRRKYLSLITDHVHLHKSEIPFRDICCCRSCHRIGVEQLSGNKGKSQNNTKHLRCSHFLCNRPADTNRQHMEDCLTDQPQKAVKSGPKLTDVT